MDGGLWECRCSYAVGEGDRGIGILGFLIDRQADSFRLNKAQRGMGTGGAPPSPKMIDATGRVLPPLSSLWGLIWPCPIIGEFPRVIRDRGPSISLPTTDFFHQKHSKLSPKEGLFQPRFESKLDSSHG